MEEFIKHQKLLLNHLSASVSPIKKLPEEYKVQILVYDCTFHLHPSVKYRNIRFCSEKKVISI